MTRGRATVGEMARAVNRWVDITAHGTIFPSTPLENLDKMLEDMGYTKGNNPSVLHTFLQDPSHSSNAMRALLDIVLHNAKANWVRNLDAASDAKE